MVFAGADRNRESMPESFDIRPIASAFWGAARPPGVGSAGIAPGGRLDSIRRQRIESQASPLSLRIRRMPYPGAERARESFEFPLPNGEVPGQREEAARIFYSHGRRALQPSPIIPTAGLFRV